MFFEFFKTRMFLRHKLVGFSPKSWKMFISTDSRAAEAALEAVTYN